MKILIVPYDPTWPEQFERERKRLQKALHPIDPEIEHIGSTSVPGLGAKPVVDIMIGLPDFSIADDQVPRITALGYEYIDRWEDEIPDRRLFSRVVGGQRLNNIHMVEKGTDWWSRHLLFRDYLRQHDDTRDAYYELKKQLAEREWDEVNEYARAKTKFIRKVESIAREQQG